MTITISGTTGIVGANIADGTITTVKLAETTIQTLTPAGTVGYFAMVTAPTGWLICNGAEISRTTYADLFTAIGTTYGVGDGSSTFDLPDLRGEFIRSLDDGRGVDTGRSLGSSQSDTQRYTITQFETAAAVGTAGGLGTRSLLSDGTTAYRETGANDAGNGTGIRFTVAVADTKPRNIALLACIKY